MKKILTFFGLLLAGALVSAQSNVIDKYFNDLQEVDNVTKVNVQEKTFELFTEIETKDAQEEQLIASIRKLEGIKGIFLENSSEAPQNYADGFNDIMSDGDYEELMSLSNPNDKGIVMIREEDDKILEMMVMFNSANEFGVFTIFGDLDIKRVGDIGDVIRKNGKAWFDVFENISQETLVFNPSVDSEQNVRPVERFDSDLDLTIFPNPAIDHVMLTRKSGENQSVQLGFFTLIGEEILALDKVQLPYRLDINDIPSGSYFVRIANDDGAFKNFKIVKPN